MAHIQVFSKSRLRSLFLLIHILVFIPAASAQGRLPEADFFSYTPVEHDQFGYQIAEHNGRLLVSAPAPDVPGPGMVYLFDKNTHELIHVFLPDDDADADHWYGANIAINDDCIVISATIRWLDSLIYVYDPTTFELITKIDSGPEKQPIRGDITMDINGTDLLVGLPYSNVHDLGAGQVFLYEATSATLLEEITPSEYVRSGSFGGSVSINENHIVISAMGITPNDIDYGAVYLFDRGNGQQLNKLVDNQVTDNYTSFGLSVKLDQNTLAITRSTWTISDINNQEYAVQLYDISDPTDQTPSYTQISMPDTEYDLQGFGFGIAMNENFIAVMGTMELGHLDFTKGIFVYDLPSLSLIEVVRANRIFQAEVYISPVLDSMDRLYFGHMLNGIEGAAGPGVVHQYQLTNCPQDLNHDGSLDTEDINLFIKARMDWNDTLSFNYFDISAFIEDFRAGCP